MDKKKDRLEKRREFVKRCYQSRSGTVSRAVQNIARSVFLSERVIYKDIRALKDSGQL